MFINLNIGDGLSWEVPCKEIIQNYCLSECLLQVIIVIVVVIGVDENAKSFCRSKGKGRQIKSLAKEESNSTLQRA